MFVLLLLSFSASMSTLTVYLGKQTLNGPNPNQIARGVKQVILHPNYNSATQDNDIALLRLNSSVTFTNYIRPVCLAGQGSSFPDNTNCWITGWGRVASGGTILTQTLTCKHKSLCTSKHTHIILRSQISTTKFFFSFFHNHLSD